MTAELYVANRDEWRAWLEKNSCASKGVWLIYFKNHTGKASIPYDDSVEEAICFGWIDGIIKKLDDERYVRKFMPRRTGSKWSESNKKKAERMMEQGMTAEAGIATIREAKENGEWFRTPMNRKELVIPKPMQQALAKNRKALANFDKLASSHKRQYVSWVSAAKKEETQKKRLTEAITLLEQNKKLGLK